jgi:hypothetical protein
MDTKSVRPCATAGSERGGRERDVAKVFLSYSREDRHVADKIAHDLTDSGIEVWYDANLLIGANWRDEISRNLQSAVAVILLLSPASIASESVKAEWGYALQHSTRIFPVRIPRTGLPPDVPEELKNLNYLDLGENYELALARLVTEIRQLAESAEPLPSEVLDIDKIVETVTAKVYERIGMSAPAGGYSVQEDTVDDKLLFVICSFDPSMEPTYEAIVAAASKAGLRAERVKDIGGDYRITEKILSMIRRARLIVVDLTHERPNVYFELGYARGIGKTIITICREGAPVHFDVYDWTYLSYIDSRPLERDLLKRLKFELQIGRD